MRYGAYQTGEVYASVLTSQRVSKTKLENA